MAVGFVGDAALTISRKVFNTRTAFIVMVVAGVASFFFRNPFSFPILILIGGVFTAFKYKRQPLEEKSPIKIQWANFLLWAGVFILAASLGAITKYKTVLLFENFYRNGSLIFGGGQVLIPYLYTEFVDFKDYLTSEEFLSGFAMVQALPGPVFSFSAYIGALSSREFGTAGEVAGALVAAIGIFLPGTFLIFFVIRFWESVKKFRIIRASLEGISAASAGMVAAAAILLFLPLEHNALNLLIVVGTFSLLTWTKIPAPIIIITGIVLGLVI
jgi:chromate transporter